MYNVFQKGLVRGSAHLPHDPEKAYAYVEHPKGDWRVYLRSCMFLHPANEPFRRTRFLVVKKTKGRTWEPPKGQMEAKECKKGTLLECLVRNALRETEEEAHLRVVRDIQHTGLVLQSQEPSYPKNHFFQYHIFQGRVEPEEIKQAFDKFEWRKEHPAEVARWRNDRKEKDALDWFQPGITRLHGRWSPDLVAMYLERVSNTFE